MILLNFSHPLTLNQLAQIGTLTGQAIDLVVEMPAQFDPAQPFGPQVVALVDDCDLTPAEWQTAPIVVAPPALNFIAVALLVELVA
ncbi:MAG: CRISPR-associated protein Csx15, partial [Chloroflexota bacterium]|nr:CRISPR-associated protein Csx15 [Chloroflexota bacterium]